jgi:beta-lactam-binding protein with PASTA domain
MLLGLGVRTSDVLVPTQDPYLAAVSQVALGSGGSGLAIASPAHESVPVPDVRGDDVPTATAALEKAGLQPGTVTYVGVCSNPGFVVDQDPEAVVRGVVTMVPAGSAVSLKVGRLKLCPPG